MIVHIYHRTLLKYRTTNDDYNKIIINSILNKEKKSRFYQLYLKNTEEIYFCKMFNLYKSIKLLIKITENTNQNNIKYNPFLLNKIPPNIPTKSKAKNKIVVIKKVKEKNVGVVNNLKIENSLSSIRKAIDSDEKDYEAGNEILLLLRNFQKNSNDKDNDIIYRKLSHIYKKKKSPNSNFHFMLSKNSPNKNSINNITSNKMINNNIYINNNNYNNSTNLIISNYNKLSKFKIEKKNSIFINKNSNQKINKSNGQIHLFLSRLNNKNIYTKKNVSSLINIGKRNKATELNKYKIDNLTYNFNDSKKYFNEQKNLEDFDELKLCDIPPIKKNNKFKKIKILEIEDELINFNKDFIRRKNLNMDNLLKTNFSENKIFNTFSGYNIYKNNNNKNKKKWEVFYKNNNTEYNINTIKKIKDKKTNILNEKINKNKNKILNTCNNKGKNNIIKRNKFDFNLKNIINISNKNKNIINRNKIDKLQIPKIGTFKSTKKINSSKFHLLTINKELITELISPKIFKNKSRNNPNLINKIIKTEKLNSHSNILLKRSLSKNQNKSNINSNSIYKLLLSPIKKKSFVLNDRILKNDNKLDNNKENNYMIKSEKNINKYNKSLPNNNYSDNKEIFSIDVNNNAKIKKINKNGAYPIKVNLNKKPIIKYRIEI